MTFNIDLYDLRRREVQALGAALSCRDWYMTEKAYNSLRDKLDNAGFTVSGPPTTPKPPAGGDAGAVEQYRQALAPFANWATSVLTCRAKSNPDSRVEMKHDHAVITLGDLRRARDLAALALPAPVVEGWQEMGSAPNHDGAKIIGFDERWGVAEMMRDGSKLWVLASFNGQVIHCNPVRWQSTPTPPAALSEGRSHG